MIRQLSKKMAVEPSVIWHFIIKDLQEIYSDELNGPDIKLVSLKSEVAALRKSNEVLAESLDKYIKKAEVLNERIRTLKASIKKKRESIVEANQQVAELQNAKTKLDAELRATEKKAKIFQYGISMHRHNLETDRNPANKRILLLLGLFTIVAIIITLYIIYNK
jgi:chromosome segregation ATPase